jgi:hypothetical protein
MESARIRPEPTKSEPAAERGRNTPAPFVTVARRPLIFQAAHSPAVRLDHGFGPNGLQAKLTINEAGDHSEQEADPVAEQVMRMPGPAIRLQRECANGDEEKRMPILRAEAVAGAGVAEGVAAAARRMVSPSVGASLPPDVAASLERVYKHDLSNARIHTSAAAARTSADLGARAFTIGSNVYMGEGEYAPGTAAGNDLLAHEVAHVVQYERGQVTGATLLHHGASKRSDPVEQAASAMACSARPLLAAAHRRDPASRRARNASAAAPARQTPHHAPVLLWERVGGRLSEASFREIRRILSEEIQIPEDEIGDLTPLAGWSDERLDHAVAALRAIGRISVDQRGRGRVARAWGTHLDDLGAPREGSRRERYANILMFVDSLHELSASGDYATERRAMPNVRLAGWQMPVNWRVVYFVAAAQVGMDERGRDVAGGAGAGRGHYVPVGGFRQLLNERHVGLRAMLRRLGFQRGPRGAEVPRTDVIPGAAAIFSTIHDEIGRMLTVLQAQAQNRDVPGYRADEHFEPDLVNYFVSRATRILAVTTPSNDASVPEAARGLLDAIGDTGSVHMRHSAGSVDPHGTEHAMGIAIDLYYGSDPTNFGIRDAFWPFIHYLIQLHPTYGGLIGTERPTQVHTTEPRLMRVIGRLLAQHGRDAVRDLRRGVATDRSASHRGDRSDLRMLSTFRQHVRSALRDRAAALERAQQSGRLDSSDAPRVAAELGSIRQDLLAVGDLLPAELNTVVERHRRALRGLEHEAPVPQPGETATPNDPLVTVGPDDGPITLSALHADLTNPDAARLVDAGMRARRTAALRAVTSAGFEPWLHGATDDRHLVYDQPDAMVGGINAVRNRPVQRGRRQADTETFFYGGHHWAVVPLEVLRSPVAYQQSLQADLARRSPAQIERILSVMAESEGGRRILFGTRDTSFIQALSDRLRGAETAMLQRVRARVVTPFERGTDAGMELRRDLRDLGFYPQTGGTRN